VDPGEKKNITFADSFEKVNGISYQIVKEADPHRVWAEVHDFLSGPPYCALQSSCAQPITTS
jgi:hypothetical protein